MNATIITHLMRNESVMGKIAGGVQQKEALSIMHFHSCIHFGRKFALRNPGWGVRSSLTAVPSALEAVRFVPEADVAGTVLW